MVLSAAALPVLLQLAVTLPRFDGLYGQDPYAYFGYAVGPLLASLRDGTALPPFPWPPGFPLLVAVASRIVGARPLAGQLVSVVAGTLVPLLTVLLAREVWRPARAPRAPALAVPFLAGLLAATSGILRQASVVVMSDAAALAALTLGVWALARYGRTIERDGATPSLGWLLLAAASVAFAVLTRWASALAALAAVAYAAVLLARLARRRPAPAALHALLAGLVGLIVLLPVLGPALATVGERGGSQPFTVDLQIVEWRPANALRASFETPDGHLEHPHSMLYFYGLAPAWRVFLTPVLALFLPLGLWRVLRERGVGPLLLLVAWPAVVTVFLAGIAWQSFRFPLTLLPPVAILAAIGVVAAWEVAPRRLRALVPAAVVAALVWMAVAGQEAIAALVAQEEAAREVIEWTEAEVPQDAVVLTFSLTSAFEQRSDIDVRDLFLISTPELEALAAGRRPLFALVDPRSLERQWRDHAPARNLRRLATTAALVERGRRGRWILYEVEDAPAGELALAPDPAVPCDDSRP